MKKDLMQKGNSKIKRTKGETESNIMFEMNKK